MTNNYYKKKEKIEKEVRERYQSLSKEEIDKKCKYALERYKIIAEEEKEKRRRYGRE